MKQILPLVSVLIALSITSAHAFLGFTISELESKFGVKISEKTRENGTSFAAFGKDGIGYYLNIYEGKCIAVSATTDKAMPPETIQKLLDSCAEGSTWIQKQTMAKNDMNRWVRNDGGAYAIQTTDTELSIHSQIYDDLMNKLEKSKGP